ncbi:MAG: AAA family ATPase [Myxococcota bacterium]
MRVHFGQAFLEQLQRVDARQALQSLQSWPANPARLGPYVLKPVKRGHFVAVGRELKRGEQLVPSWLQLYHRNSTECTTLNGNWRDFAAQQLVPIEEKETRRLLEAPLSEQATPGQIPLGEHYHPWLQPLDYALDDQQLYETAGWIDQLNSQELKSFLSEICHALANVVDNKEVRLTPVPDWPAFRTFQSEYLHYVVAPLSQVERPHFVLLWVDRNKDWQTRLSAYLPREVLLQFHQELQDLQSSKSALTTLDVVAQRTRRTYPAWLLFDVDLWQAVVRGGNSNLCLSAEELDILHALTGNPTSSRPQLPLFLEGRAGSGKSTLLAYVYTRFWAYKWRHKLPGSPLYLTLNERLLVQAKNTCRVLITKQAELVGDRSMDASVRQEEEEELSGAFKTIRQLLTGLLQEQLGETTALADRFVPEKHISFHRFEQLYTGAGVSEEEQPWVCRSYRKYEYPAELVWFVIRAFIKGWEEESFLTPEDFRELPRDTRRMLSPDDFETIHHALWEGWYQKLMQEHGFWDDEDLVRFALVELPVLPSYTLICCDEAQDLTRLEARLLVRLSHFTHHPLPALPDVRLPFLLAGDPFQTVNPSGFRLATLKDIFYQELNAARSEVASERSSSTVRLEVKELTYNDCSAASIVSFTNRVQAWRCGLFQLGAAPQKSWQIAGGLPPRLFMLGTQLTSEDLPTLLKDSFLIVDAPEGGEREFAERDELLGPLMAQKVLGEHNLFSPTTVKGLEHSTVVVYGFGQKAPTNPYEVDSSEQEPDKDRLQREYFWNRLYVALTRATKVLFILDTPAGDTRLWERLQKQELPSGLKNEAEWRSRISVLERADKTDLRLLSEHDPVALAENLFREGVESNNPVLLRKASGYFESLRMSKRAQTCLARALELEGHPRDAAKVWEKVGDEEALRYAVRLYWEALAWSELARLGKTQKLTPEQEALSEFLRLTIPTSTSSRSKEGDLYLQALERMINRLHILLDERGRPTLQSPAWRSLRERMMHLLERENKKRWLPDRSVMALAEVLERLQEAGPGTLDMAARAYFLLERWQDALRCWDKLGKRGSQDYARAKAELSSPPESLRWFNQAGLYRRTVELWQQARSSEASWVEPVAEALTQLQEWANLITLHLERERAGDEAAFVIRDHHAQMPESLLTQQTQRVFDALSKRKLFHTALELADVLVNARPSESGLLWAARALSIWCDNVGRIEKDPAALERTKERAGKLLDKLVAGYFPVSPQLSQLLPPADLVKCAQRLQKEADRQELLNRLSMDPSPEARKLSTVGQALQKTETPDTSEVLRPEPEVIHKSGSSQAKLSPAASEQGAEREVTAPVPTSAPLDWTRVKGFKLEQLRLRNFKAYEDALLEFEDLTVLIGKNGAGKSTVREALEFLRDALTERLSNAVSKRGGLALLLRQGARIPVPSLLLAVQCSVMVGTRPYRLVYGFELMKDLEENGRVTQEHLSVESSEAPAFERKGMEWRSDLPGLKPVLGYESLLLPVLAEQHPLWHHLYNGLSRLCTYDIKPDELRKDCQARTGEPLEADGSNAPNVLADLERQHRQELRWLTEYLASVLPGISLLRTESRKGQRSLYFEQEAEASMRLETTQVSVGTLRALGVLLALFQQPPPSLVFIEEPEDSIHIQALDSLIDAMTSRLKGMQVVLTSHNTVVLMHPAITFKRTRLLAWHRGKSRIHRLVAEAPSVDDMEFSVGELLQSNALTLDAENPRPEPVAVRGPFFAVERV